MLWVTPDKSLAKYFAEREGAVLRELYANIENPWEWDPDNLEEVKAFASTPQGKASVEDLADQLISEYDDEDPETGYIWTRDDFDDALDVVVTLSTDANETWRISEMYGFPAFLRERGYDCLLYTSDAADDLPCVDLGGRRIIKKKKKK